MSSPYLERLGVSMVYNQLRIGVSYTMWTKKNSRSWSLVTKLGSSVRTYCIPSCHDTLKKSKLINGVLANNACTHPISKPNTWQGIGLTSGILHEVWVNSANFGRPSFCLKWSDKRFGGLLNFQLPIHNATLSLVLGVLVLVIGCCAMFRVV